MIINPVILEKYGAKPILFKKGEILFRERSEATHFYQVASGIVKMNNFNEEGTEFIQGMFHEGESFGEPPLFGDFKYPSNAEAVTESVLWKIPKENFLNLLKENFDLHLKFCSLLSQRLQFKAMIAKEISTNTPEHRILTLIEYFQKKSSKNANCPFFEVPFTRQQIADMTGLRVETVIRTIKALTKENKLQIINRKVFYPAEKELA
ncbi:Crp/Fnr family transcriptional regulator [Mangrovivirga cuniculi]|uniref:Crp/Fnr family transcriptional regulator n=1 Tax=Mangrovivirga cuniculi TaxID=2715131 RepID=UPI001C301205|nr:Crp/Fnr family transcriptional regulator [Mangrovivirga cuniculi]